MTDIIDINKWRNERQQPEPDEILNLTVDVAPGAVILRLHKVDSVLQFALSPEGARQLSARLTTQAILAQIERKGGEDDNA